MMSFKWRLGLVTFGFGLFAMAIANAQSSSPSPSPLSSGIFPLAPGAYPTTAPSTTPDPLPSGFESGLFILGSGSPIPMPTGSPEPSESPSPSPTTQPAACENVEVPVVQADPNFVDLRVFYDDQFNDKGTRLESLKTICDKARARWWDNTPDASQCKFVCNLWEEFYHEYSQCVQNYFDIPHFEKERDRLQCELWNEILNNGFDSERAKELSKSLEFSNLLLKSAREELESTDNCRLLAESLEEGLLDVDNSCIAKI